MRPTLPQLLDVLSDNVDWYILGVHLDISTGALDAVREEHITVERRLAAMLGKWLNKYPERGWSTIIDVLRKMDDNSTADRITEQYCVQGTCYNIVMYINGS